ncbi:MAG: MBL fold metallo-hydrolase [Acidobacteria bacterium]|nr:MBL fold metallo-hydrolase [Acidobacteriota bacterium]
MSRPIVLGAVIVFGALSMTAKALQQPAPSAAAIEVDKLADNLFVLKALAGGGGGNTSVLVTATGVVVVDTKNPGWGRPLLDKIKTITDKPVTMIINTHTHGDHVSGNVEFPAAIDVVAHENTKANMEAMRPASFVAQPAGGPPPNIFTRNNGTGMAKRTFKDSMTIGAGADRIELHYFGRAHTNGDAMVFFPAARAFHMADVFANKGMPGMDSNNGGTGVGYAATLTKAADFADKVNVQTIINGHNAATTTRADLREFIQYVGDFVKTAQDGKRSGKSVDDVVQAWKTPAKYAGYEPTSPAVRVKANVELIYKETN